MKKSKYLNKIYDGRWKVIKITYTDSKHQHYILENIYNAMQITISPDTMKKISEGKSTIYSSIWMHNCKHKKG